MCPGRGHTGGSPQDRGEPHVDGVVVTTAAGEWAAPTAVVTAGAWTATLLDGPVELPPMVTTQEQVAFLRPRASDEQPSLIHRGETVHFGMPTLDGDYKLGERDGDAGCRVDG